MANFPHRIPQGSPAIKVHYDGPSLINAIKALRSLFDVSLKEAKEAVESNYFLISEEDYQWLCDETKCYGWDRGTRYPLSVVHSFGNLIP